MALTCFIYRICWLLAKLHLIFIIHFTIRFDWLYLALLTIVFNY